MPEVQLQSLCQLIRQLGIRAQELRDAGLQIDKKARQDFVSHADLFVEQEIGRWLKIHRPRDGILGEESGLKCGEQGTWVIDPIDGTTNYIQGMDYWCISLALVSDNQVEIGIIYAPDRDEFFFAQRGKGAFLNDRRLTLREPAADTVIIGMGRSSRAPVENYTHTLAAILNDGMEYRRFGAGALMLAHVAAGWVHAYYEARMHSWDALAGILLILEAGGASNDFLADNGLLNGNLVLAGCPNVQERLTSLLTT